MQTELHGFEYATVVNRIASYLLARRGQVDVLGNMRDDYVSELCIEAMLASKTFKKKYGGCRKTEARYVYKSLWNYARMKNRSRLRNKNSGVRFQPLNGELDPVNLEAQMEARSSIRALRKNLRKENLAILAQVAESNGDITEAWKEDPTCHRWWFNSKVQRARDAAKKVLRD